MNAHALMKRALTLARKGCCRVSPNPMVGAVIVRHGRVIAEGYHHRYGGDHAEIDAMKKCDPGQLRNADMYVTLEPCSHYGKTPPCADAIAAAGISRVFIGMEDPNPRVQGRGIARLREAGITVVTGIEESACRELNYVYCTFIARGTPYITLKSAQTLDGFIAAPDGRSHWITGESSRARVHRMRAEHDAVLVGINTVLQDDCRLTVRSVRLPDPKRLVLDARLRFPLASAMAHSGDPRHIIIAASETAPEERAHILEDAGLTVWRLPESGDGLIDLERLLERAGREKIASILVEGGNGVFSSFLRGRFCDRLAVFIAPKLFGDGIPPFSHLGLDCPGNPLQFSAHTWKSLGDDMLFEGRL
ncbi:bifunctional diaminohydroxyphosphoribosylaminopyrimidine deaminase/5-amino-6-(5-phosphoribosylamino)uracil reductase RibD [bacterium]|nr:bifunctional diaminohydroxyphosphoribosylaminopyrimidine deaminase/5-amino-6-(5-phosphoribosylamino)uracil reductase RibD [bacterium]